jgi:hypothetical protein
MNYNSLIYFDIIALTADFGRANYTKKYYYYFVN